MDDSPPKPARRVNWALPVALVAITIVLVVVMSSFLTDKEPPVVPPSDKGTSDKVARKLTREESLHLLELRDRSLGLLENHEFDKAEPLLTEIIRSLPEDPFGPRNLTIGLELAIEKLDQGRDAEKAPAAIGKARQAAEQLAAIEPDSAVPYILAARVALKENDAERALAALRKAVELDPKSAHVWYELFLVKPISPGEPPADETVKALGKAYELQPNNLFVLKDWLPLQVQLKSPHLADVIKQSRVTLEPFADVIKTNIRQDVIALVDKLAKAVDDQQWQAATSSSMMIRNIVVAESARDERYVHWNSLEYLLFDFGQSFYDRAILPDPVSSDIPVKFVSGTTVGPLSGATDVVVSDLDFDGKPDGAGLVGSKLVIAMSLSAPPSEASLAIDLGVGFDRVLAVDLDDDIDRKLEIQSKLHRNSAADLDLIVFGPAGLKLFEDQTPSSGSRTFVEKPAGDGLGSLRNVRVVVPADLDLDGDIDLLTITSEGVRAWSNKGNWSFDEITSRSLVPSTATNLTAAVAVDWDRDSDIDVLVATADGLGLLENMHHGRFRWKLLDGDFAEVKGATSVIVEQRGSRPSWSVIAAGPGGIQALWTATSNAGVVSSSKKVSVANEPASRIQSLDFDNDGLRDLVAIADSKAALWRGLPDGSFQPHKDAIDFNPVSCCAIADADQDGDEDLLVNASESKWVMNEGGNANGWLDVMLIAEQRKPNEQNYSKRVNNLGIGSMIEVRAGGQYQAQVVHSQTTHFGLGSQKNADVMRVLWTNGLPNNLVEPKSNQRIYEEQYLLGSCPYLYSWDGEKFVFVTDLLWNAPLGLKFAEDVVAPWREWEYLKIDGDKLRARNGTYPLRITAELWEVEYFDQVKLFAIDHPAGTDIYTNEKVGPESLAQHKIHTVSSPHKPVAARDPHGRDILDQVIARDGVYSKTYDRKFAQGLTNEHYLELDLGEFSGATTNETDNGTRKPVITLFLTGWMFPGSTSLRVQHSQNPDLLPPQPPSLHAVDANGNWRVVQPFMGFPGGKTKTIAVDISDVFEPGSQDHRLRIATNMEFYWDAAFFTVNEKPARYREVELPLGSAKLVDRGGVSRHSWPESGNGPDQFDYHHLIPGDAWPPIQGAFTRFGDVLPLLTNRDDQLVVMHPGDEIQLEFEADTEPLPEGWVRDFVIYNVGWDKDCDQHTVYGETSEPLPFREMTDYPFKNGEPRAMDPDYVTYLKTYQTRTRPRSPFWNKVSRP